MKLSKYEKETIILTNEEDRYYSVYTFNQGLQKRLKNFAERYPGDESIEVTKEDLDVCADAVEHCRESILKMIQEIENELNENEES